MMRIMQLYLLLVGLFFSQHIFRLELNQGLQDELEKNRDRQDHLGYNNAVKLTKMFRKHSCRLKCQCLQNQCMVNKMRSHNHGAKQKDMQTLEWTVFILIFSKLLLGTVGTSYFQGSWDSMSIQVNFQGIPIMSYAWSKIEFPHTLLY